MALGPCKSHGACYVRHVRHVGSGTEDMLEGMVFLLVGVIVLYLKCNKDVMLEGEVV